MDCIEARALKSSFLSQMALKTNSHGFYNDDLRCFAGINCVSPDDFPVEDLLNLDFNDNEFQDGCFFLEDDDEKVSHKRNSYDYSSTFSGTDEFDSLSAGELPVPVEDLESLEWLSHFVDDSTSEFSLLCPAGSFTGKTEAAWANWSEPSSKPVQKIRYPCFPLKVPGKARSKSRANGRPWSLESPMLSADESSSTSSSSHGSCTLSPFVFTNLVQDIDWFSSVEKPPAKKQKVKPDVDSGLVSGRRCTHCQVQKTPQWRAGPLGPKTLCNACGVRYKSGRLFPEYRPACSPTFSLEIHSNSHRKVLEMRRQREMHESAAEPGLIPIDRSFEM